MKKNKKIIIGIVLLLLIVIVGILIFNKIRTQDIWNSPVSSNKVNNSEEIGRMIKLKGILYCDTGEKNTEFHPEMIEGQITSTIEKGEIPKENGQANFTGVEGYQYGKEYTIEVLINGEWVIFAPKSFCGTIKKVKYNDCILVEPEEREEIRKTANLIKVGIIKLDTNVKFEVGEKIRVTYTGEVLDKYTAEVYAITYESLDNYKETITLNSKTASNEILIKFNGILYGKSFSLIDYAGGGEKIGTIDKLIDSKYIPKFDGETNNKEILGANVFETGEKTIVLNYNNTYVLFEKI